MMKPIEFRAARGVGIGFLTHGTDRIHARPHHGSSIDGQPQRYQQCHRRHRPPHPRGPRRAQINRPDEPNHSADIAEQIEARKNTAWSLPASAIGSTLNTTGATSAEKNTIPPSQHTRLSKYK